MSILKYSDAAYRMSDIVRQAIVDGHQRRWIAFRLSDGGSDGVLYDSKSDAMSHQLHETQCAYFQVPLDDLGPRGAESFLATHRKLYDSGARIIDPDRHVMMPLPSEELLAMIRSLRR